MRQRASTVRFYQTTRKIVSSLMVVLMPGALLAVDSNAAMLQTRGRVFVNGSQVPYSMDLFSGDQVETQAESVASISSPGSTLTLPDSAVKFESGAINLRHGGLMISTSKGMSVRAGCLVISPGSASWTDFQVADSDGVVAIAARRGTINIEGGGVTAPLLEGQQTTGSDCARGPEKRKSSGGAVPGVAGGVLDSKVVKIAAVAIAGGVLIWVLAQGEQPVSPSKP